MISFAETDEHAHASKAGKGPLNLPKERIRRIFGDKGYDSNSIFIAFWEDAIISPRNNASSKSRGSLPGAEQSERSEKNQRMIGRNLLIVEKDGMWRYTSQT